jgi:hypothetical protein
VERVQEVVANPEPYSPLLLSRGLGDRFLIWDVSQPDTEPQEIRPERHVFFGLTWRSGQPFSAAYVGKQLLLRTAEGTTYPLPFQEPISMLRFSQGGQYLAAWQRNLVDIRRFSDLYHVAALPYSGLLQSMQISNDGRWLLTVGQKTSDSLHTVMVWDVSKQQVCWQLAANPLGVTPSDREPAMQLQHCQGLSIIEQAYWQSQGVTV